LAELAPDLHESVTQFASGPGEPAIEMAVEIKCAAEDLAGVDHSELCCSAALAKPSIADEEGARVMIETHWQVEFVSKLVRQGITVER
jgi:hypothetical protein